ncbi:hypothetical protein K1W54_28880, partial [Micromonospora sp. CPCC 205371]|nr:hypothetical protein [Micromonospora sp. CPCC 205371]
PPAAPRIWPLRPRAAALPGAGLTAAPSRRAAPPSFHSLLEEYADARTAISVRGSWEGAGAEVFAAHQAALSGHLDGLTAKLSATDAYAEAVAGWVRESRGAVAGALVPLLASAEAVTVSTEPVGPESAVAAAEIAAEMLAAVDEAYDRLEALMRDWEVDLTELPYQPPAVGAPPIDLTTRIGP